MFWPDNGAIAALLQKGPEFWARQICGGSDCCLAFVAFSARRGGDALGVVCRVSVARVFFAGFNFLN
jgi:hypothetical protein